LQGVRKGFLEIVREVEEYSGENRGSPAGCLQTTFKYQIEN
jgi:hypothetical protein